MNSTVKINQEEGQFSHSLQTEDQYGNPVIIPVIDVRDGPAHRAVVEKLTKSLNRLRGSRFIPKSRYNDKTLFS